MIVQAALLSVVTAALSYFFVESELLDRPRIWLLRNGPPLIDRLFNCGYCLSHWVAGALVLVFRVHLFSIWWPLDFLLTVMAIAWAASFQYVMMTILWERLMEHGPEEK